jgi:hypothetical protein
MRMTTPKLLLFLIILILSLNAVIADQEQYLTHGIDRVTTYQQSGIGLWAGRSPIVYVQTFMEMQSISPLVGDVDGDGVNEIVIMADDQLNIFNYTADVGIILEQSLTHGNMTAGQRQYLINPGLFDTDNDGILEIITSNISHMNVYSWNGSTILLNKSAVTGLNWSNTQPLYTAIYWPTHTAIKCASGNQISDGVDTCVWLTNNRSGVTIYSMMLSYDIENNDITPNVGGVVSSPFNQIRIPHFYDVDKDGFYEVYAAKLDYANGVNSIYKSLVPGNGTMVTLYTHDEAASRMHSDIIVNNIDGSTPSISWAYTADANNFDIRTIRASDAAVTSSGYCTLFTCPEGEQSMMSSNLFIPTGGYIAYTGDVCVYIRNPEGSQEIGGQDPNEDVVYCVGQYAGDGFTQTIIPNTINLSNQHVVHYSALTGVSGVLTSSFIVQGSTKETAELLGGTNIPVDYEQSGSLDIIGINDTRLFYYDDGYSNQNVDIDVIAPDTGNPICAGETLTTTLTISDVESDSGDCYIRVTYANGTTYGTSNYSSTAFNEGVSSVNLFFTATPTSTLNLIHYYSCKDQYHTSYDEQAYAVTYSSAVCGSGSCNCKGYGAPIPTVLNTSSDAAANEMDEIIDEVLDPLLGTGTKLKAIAGIGIVIGIIVSVAAYTTNPFVLAITAMGSFVLVTFLGLISAYILVLFILIIAFIILIWKFVSGGSNGGG